MCTALENRRLSGFTLIEVVAALTILSLMAGTIFTIVNGATQATSEIEMIRGEDHRVETCLQRFRDLFATLPNGANLEIKVVDSAPLRQELIVRGAPEAFVFGDDPVYDVPELVFSLRKYPTDDGVGSPAQGEVDVFSRKSKRLDAQMATAATDQETPMFFALSTPNFFRPPDERAPAGTQPRSPVKRREGNQFVSPDKDGRFWIELLPDVAELRWRFWHPGKKTWLEKHGPARPPLVELELRLRGRKFPVRAVFSPRR